MTQRKIVSWYTIGYRDAKAGKPYRPPENYNARMGYQQGYMAREDFVANGSIGQESDDDPRLAR